MTEKTKHEFVDDNPYLVYSGDINASYNADSGSGGGGGGGDAGDNGVFYVTITSETPMDNWSNDDTNPTLLSSDKSHAEILQAITDGKTIIVKAPLSDEETSKELAYLPLINHGENTAAGTNFIVFNLIMMTGVSSLTAYQVVFLSGTALTNVAGFKRIYSFA